MRTPALTSFYFTLHEQLERQHYHAGVVGTSGLRANVSTLLGFDNDFGFAYLDRTTLDFRFLNWNLRASLGRRYTSGSQTRGSDPFKGLQISKKGRQIFKLRKIEPVFDKASQIRVFTKYFNILRAVRFFKSRQKFENPCVTSLQ